MLKEKDGEVKQDDEISIEKDAIPRPNSPDFDFPLTQLPNPTPEYSPDYSQSPFQGSQFCPSQFVASQNMTTTTTDSQNQKLDFWSQEKVTFNLDDSQQGCSQSHCSQFYCSQCDEVAFCSQMNPSDYNPRVCPENSYECVPTYRASVLAEIRANDIKLTPQDPIFKIQDIITIEDRENRVNWMIDNMIQLEVSARALFLAVRLFDRVLSCLKMDADTLLLYSTACLSLGAKFENSFAQPVSSYAESSQNFNEDEIINGEKDILICFDFLINQPTEIFFLKMWLNQIQADEEMMMTAVFVGFNALIDIKVRTETAEVVAAAVLKIAVNACNPSYGLEPIQETTKRYGIEKIRKCEEIIVATINLVVEDKDSTLRNLFAIPERCSVSTKFQYEVNI